MTFRLWRCFNLSILKVNTGAGKMSPDHQLERYTRPFRLAPDHQLLSIAFNAITFIVHQVISILQPMFRQYFPRPLPVSVLRKVLFSPRSTVINYDQDYSQSKECHLSCDPSNVMDTFNDFCDRVIGISMICFQTG